MGIINVVKTYDSTSFVEENINRTRFEYGLKESDIISSTLYYDHIYNVDYKGMPMRRRPELIKCIETLEKEDRLHNICFHIGYSGGIKIGPPINYQHDIMVKPCRLNKNINGAGFKLDNNIYECADGLNISGLYANEISYNAILLKKIIAHQLNFDNRWLDQWNEYNTLDLTSFCHGNLEERDDVYDIVLLLKLPIPQFSEFDIDIILEQKLKYNDAYVQFREALISINNYILNDDFTPDDVTRFQNNILDAIKEVYKAAEKVSKIQYKYTKIIFSGKHPIKITDPIKLLISGSDIAGLLIPYKLCRNIIAYDSGEEIKKYLNKNEYSQYLRFVLLDNDLKKKTLK
jgi:hypothetical protein